MNRDRRKQLNTQRALLAQLAEELSRFKSRAEDIKAAIEAIQFDEQDYRDSMPDSLQDGEKGAKASEAVDAMDRAIQALDEIDALDLDDALEALDEAQA